MATRRWLGTAKDVKQVDTIVVGGTWLATETITITIANVTLNITVGAATPTTAEVATLIKQAWNGETLTDTAATVSPTIAQGGGTALGVFAEITATVSSSTVTLTADTAGKPFTITSATETSTSGTLTHNANVTTATGRNWFSDQDNWSGNTVPVDQDDIVFDQGSVSVKYGLTPAIQPASVKIYKTYTGQIGLAETNSDDSSLPYSEYRTKYLTFDQNASDTTTYDIGIGSGSGSGLIRIDAGAGQVILNVYGTGTAAMTGQPVVLFLGTHVSNVVNAYKGDVGLGFYGGEAAVVATLRNGDGTTSGATTTVGSGCTLTTVNANSGTVTLRCAATTVTGWGGTINCEGTGAYTTINVGQDGLVNYKSNGTVGTLVVGVDGTFDRSVDLRTMTITNAVQLASGGTLNDPSGVITYSAGITLQGKATLGDVTLNVGPGRTLSIT